MEAQLAIIIPAYKAEFLGDSLASLARQSCQAFRVYVGDDASTEDLASIVRSCRLPKDRMRYVRFEQNMGGRSLVAHWHRCIHLTQEPWIWLFSDDDVAGVDCVAQFYHTLERTAGQYDVYRFNVEVINEHNETVALHPPHPEVETWHGFLYFLLRRQRLATQQELVFSRHIYKKVGGFVDVPLAWGSDHLFAIACGTHRGLRAITGERVKFRQSGINYSSLRSRRIDRLKMEANILCARWLMRHIEQYADGDGFPSQPVLRSLVRERVLNGLKVLHPWVGLSFFQRHGDFLRSAFGIGPWELAARIMYYKIMAAGRSLRRRLFGSGGE